MRLLLSKKVIVPSIEIQKTYFLLLPLALLFSIILHELGHALLILAQGDSIASFSITRVTSKSGSYTLWTTLAGPLVNLILCYLAMYKFFNDSKNRNLWFAAIVSNFSPPISLIYSSTPHDQTRIMNFLGMSPAAFYMAYFAIFSPPLLILLKAPNLPLKEKIAFYLYSLVIIIAEIKFLNFASTYLKINF